MAIATATVATGETGNATRGGSTPAVQLPLFTDDQILGIDTASGPRSTEGRSAHGRVQQRGNGNGAVKLNGAGGDASALDNGGAGEVAEGTSLEAGVDAGEGNAALTGAEAPEELRGIFEEHPELRRDWQEARAYREIFPTVEAAREYQKLFPTAEEARAAGKQLGEVAQLDALFFSNRPEAHAELAAAVYRMDPQAFRGLSRMMAVIAQQGESAGGAAGSRAEENGAADGGRSAPPTADNATSGAAQAVGAKPAEGPATAAQTGEEAARAREDARGERFGAFYHEANGAAVHAVIDAIQAQTDRLLPEGTAQGARNRVVGEIYRELDASLRANRALAQQVRDAFRGGSLDAEHQRAVVSLIVGRARQALPAAAKKVIGEWTHGVLAAHDQKIGRQRSAEKRVDLTGSGSAGASGHRVVTARDVNYRKMSDGDILNL